mgnify:CR=1 FL=1
MTLAEIRRYMTSWQREPAVVRLASVSRAAWRARQISIQRGAAHSQYNLSQHLLRGPEEYDDV